MENEKIILAAYLCVDDYASEDIPTVLESASRNFSELFKQDDIRTIVVPVRNRDSEIVCINPKLVSEKEYEKAKASCDKLEKAITEFISTKNKD